MRIIKLSLILFFVLWYEGRVGLGAINTEHVINNFLTRLNFRIPVHLLASH